MYHQLIPRSATTFVFCFVNSTSHPWPPLADPFNQALCPGRVRTDSPPAPAFTLLPPRVSSCVRQTLDLPIHSRHFPFFVVSSLALPEQTPYWLLNCELRQNGT